MSIHVSRDHSYCLVLIYRRFCNAQCGISSIIMIRTSRVVVMGGPKICFSVGILIAKNCICHNSEFFLFVIVAVVTFTDNVHNFLIDISRFIKKKILNDQYMRDKC